MAITGGREVNVGIGIETTPGTPVAAAFYPQFTDLSMQAVSEKLTFEGARGVRNRVSNSIIRRRMSRGSVATALDPVTAALLFRLALGSIASATASGETIVYEHTISVQNANATMKTFTMLIERGGVVTERFSNCAINALNLECSDGFAMITADIVGGFPDTGTVTETYTKPTLFAYSNMTVKFGTSITNALAAAATKVKGMTLNIDNAIQEDEAFLSGSDQPQAWVNGPLTVTGSYTIQFSDTTELNKYKANTKHAAVISFTGAAIGTAEFEEVSIRLGRLVLTDPPIENDLDGVITLTQNFTVEYDSTDLDIRVIVTNLSNGATFA